MDQARERTRALICSELGLALDERDGDAYRDPSGALLDGDWLGGFAQPSVILNKVSAVSLRIDGGIGRSIDEYGEAKLAVSQDGARVELRKSYGRPGGEFRYVGALHDGTLAGYWESTVRAEFAGVFWFVRADRLEPEVAEALRRRVRRTSPKRTVLSAAMTGTLIAGLVGMRVTPLFAFAPVAATAVFAAVLHRRQENLRRDVELWRARP